MYVGSGESESDELLRVQGIVAGDREGVKAGRDDGVELIQVLKVWGDCRRAWLHVIRGMVQDGWRDSLGDF